MERTTDYGTRDPEDLEDLRRTLDERKTPEERRAQAESELRETESRLQAILNNATAVIYLKDSQGRYILVNRQFEIRFHLSQDKIVGKSDHDLFPKEIADAFRSTDMKVLETGFPLETEEQATHDAGYRTYLSVKVPLFDSAGRPYAICGIDTDITERKQAEQVVRKAHDGLDKSVEPHTAELLNANEILKEEIAQRRKAEEALKLAEEKYRSIFENAVGGIFQSTPGGRFIAANPALARMLGYDSPEELIARRTDIERQHYVDPERRHEFRQFLEERGVLYGFEYQAYKKDGSRIWISEDGRAVRDASGNLLYFEGTIKDITKRKLAEEALQKANEQLAAWVGELEQRAREMSLLSEMGDLLQVCLTMDEAFAAIAQSARKLFAPETGALCVSNAAQNLVQVVAVWGVSTSSEEVFAPEDCWALRRGRVHHVEDTQSGLLCKHLQKPLPGAYLCVPMMAQGEALGILHLSHHESGSLTESKQRLVVTVAEHVALALSNLKLHETLRSQSIRDPLTGLFNRRFMEESLAREVLRAARSQRPLGVIMLDLDGFKSFNDSFGHDAGDALLREFGFLLKNNVRAEDIACRYGGEEFTLILPEASLDATLERAEQLRSEIKNLHVHHRGQQLGRITVSLGVAVFPEHGPTGESLLRAADSALYRAKVEGRDRVVANL